MVKRGNSREPFDKVSMNAGTLQWPVVLDTKRITMKWTSGRWAVEDTRSRCRG